jgi:hypothetical protein
MIGTDSIKKKPLYLLIVLVLTLFSCTTNTEKASEMDKSVQNYQVPKLVQQEMDTEDSKILEEYSLYNSIREDGPIIPGIFQGAIPQGMAYYKGEDIMLVSNYMFDGRPSCITAISMSDGSLEKTLWLLNPDKTPHKGHVGGLAISSSYLWIASGKGVYYVSLESIQYQKDNTTITITMEGFISTEAKGSFSTYSDGILWVGEFTSRDGSYTTPKSHHFKAGENKTNHGWLAGYILDKESDMINPDHKIDGISFPDYVLSIPDEVQGAAFIDGEIILSQSYGRNNNSRISVYADPLSSPTLNSVTVGDGRVIPVWILDTENLEMEITAPPMTEGIADFNGSIAVLYESGSDKYRVTAHNPQDRISMLKIMMLN